MAAVAAQHRPLLTPPPWRLLLLNSGCLLGTTAAALSISIFGFLDPLLAAHLRYFLDVPPTAAGVIFALPALVYAVSAARLPRWLSGRGVGRVSAIALGSAGAGVALLLLGPSPTLARAFEGARDREEAPHAALVAASVQPASAAAAAAAAAVGSGVGSSRWAVTVLGLLLVGAAVPAMLVPALPLMESAAAAAGGGSGGFCRRAMSERVSSLYNSAIFFGQGMGPLVAGWLTRAAPPAGQQEVDTQYAFACQGVAVGMLLFAAAIRARAVTRECVVVLRNWL